MIDLSMGLKLILGMNGNIWIELIDIDDRDGVQKIAKIMNILRIFNNNYVAIRVATLLECYNLVKNISPNEVLLEPYQGKIVDLLSATVNRISKEKIDEIITGAEIN